jgi:hypothetical protein
MLDPVLTNNNFASFYSTRAPPTQRPVLELRYLHRDAHDPS